MKIVFVFILLLSTIISNGQTTQLKLASDVWPPFTDVESKNSFALDLVEEALSRTEVKSQMNILDFKEVMAGIHNGKFDGSAALWRSPEREKYLLFSDSYLENRLILVGKKGSNVSAGSLSELKGKRIAVVENYAYGTLLDDEKNVTLVAGKSDQQNLERLLKGEADYMLVDALLIEYLLEYQTKQAADYLAIGTNTLLNLPLYFSIRKDIPGADTIIVNFNKEIKKMISEGIYNRILQLNWVATDVDGDGRPELVLSGDKAGTTAPISSYMLMSNGQAPKEASGYLIKGNHYDNWDQVPQQYKVPDASNSYSEKRSSGLILLTF